MGDVTLVLVHVWEHINLVCSRERRRMFRVEVFSKAIELERYLNKHQVSKDSIVTISYGKHESLTAFYENRDWILLVYEV